MATIAHRIAFLDLLAPVVQEEIRRIAGPEFDIQFSTSLEKAESLRLIREADFVFAGGAYMDEETIAAGKNVRLIQKWGIGVDRIDLEAARKRGIPVTITAGANAAPVAELAIALMLAVYRRIPYNDRSLRAGKWLKAEMRETCFQLGNKTVGLVGFGAIARMVAHRLRGFDNTILYYDVNRADRVTETALRAQYVPFDELLSRSDVVSLHTPLTDKTHHLINAATLARMKPGAILVNTARGEIVDESALADALESGRLRGAGLDAYSQEPVPKEHRLLQLDNVVATPHSGGGVFDNVENVARHVVENVRKVLRGDPFVPADIIVPGERKAP